MGWRNVGNGNPYQLYLHWKTNLFRLHLILKIIVVLVINRCTDPNLSYCTGAAT